VIGVLLSEERMGRGERNMRWLLFFTQRGGERGDNLPWKGWPSLISPRRLLLNEGKGKKKGSEPTDSFVPSEGRIPHCDACRSLEKKKKRKR